ncbi:hypothetical protein [Streptomyces sp. DT203]|uniref:hypothetical protein n=1 Tax=Streptomyces sp. DT203 TaxID=3393424 RepID=UPI003CEEBF6C
MSGLVNALLITAVVAFVVVRRCSAQRISGDRRWWILPGILLVMSLREPGLMDPHRESLFRRGPRRRTGGGAGHRCRLGLDGQAVA